MNIHLRVIARMLRVGFLPALIGAGIGFAFTMLTLTQIFYVAMIVIFVVGVTSLYKITRNDIETEDKLKSISDNN